MSRVVGDNLAETAWERIQSIWDAYKYNKKDHPEVNWDIVEKADQDLLQQLKSQRK